jgi:hypothetical protein
MATIIPPLMSFDSLNVMNMNSSQSNSAPNDSLTPSSPTESASEPLLKSENSKLIEKELVKPPDSPVCEQATTFTPKLIPLERDFGLVPCDSASSQINTSNPPLSSSSNSVAHHTSNIVQSQIKAKAVDIASPDAVHLDDEEEDGDNLIIDLIQPSQNKPSTSSSNQELKTGQNMPATFTTRNLNNNNEILSNKAASPASTSTQNAHIPSSPRLVNNANTLNLSTKSPLITEEDCVNDALIS